MPKYFFPIIIIFVLSLAAAPAAFAISGECYTVDQISQVDQFLQSNANSQIQSLQNLEQSEIAEQQSTNASNVGAARAASAATGALGSPAGASDVAGAAGAGQAVINSIESQVNLQITEIQTQLNVDEYNYSLKQCTSSQSCVAQHGSESLFNTQTNRCECASGYAPDANNPFSCISMQTFCVDTVGNGAIPATNNYVDGAADSVNCTCDSGYEWNSTQSGCVAISTGANFSQLAQQYGGTSTPFNPAQFGATPVAPSAPAQLNPDGTVPNPFGSSTVPDPSFHVSAPQATHVPNAITSVVKTESISTSTSQSSSSATVATSSVATSSTVAQQGFFTATGDFFGQLFGKLLSLF